MEVSMMRYTWKVVCIIVVLVMSGVSSVRSEKEATDTYEIIMDITNRIYNDSLLKPGSVDYEMMNTQVRGAFYSIYGCFTCKTSSFYQGASAMTFSNKNGSVLVNATLTFHSNQTNADVIRDLFQKVTAGSNEINGLKINPEFTQVIRASTPAPTRVPSTSRPTTRPTTHSTTRPTTRSTTHPKTRLTTKHHNAASSFLSSPITLTSFLRYSVSFCLLVLISYSF